MGATADLAGRYYTSKPDRPEFKMTQMNIIPQSAAFICRYYTRERLLVQLTGWFYQLFLTFVAPEPNNLIIIRIIYINMLTK